MKQTKAHIAINSCIEFERIVGWMRLELRLDPLLA